jgi:hypothetical protein
VRRFARTQEDENLRARHVPGVDRARLFERRLKQRMVVGTNQVDVDRLELDGGPDVDLIRGASSPISS